MQMEKPRFSLMIKYLKQSIYLPNPSQPTIQINLVPTSYVTYLYKNVLTPWYTLFNLLPNILLNNFQAYIENGLFPSASIPFW